MSHNPSKNTLRRAELERQKEQERIEKPRKDAAKHLVALWNLHRAAGWRSMFHPSVGTALFVECHWLHVVCSACGIVGGTDLRKIDIHPDASISTVVRRMSCARCCPNPPLAVATGLTRRPWYSPGQWKRRRLVQWEIQPEGPGWGERSLQIAREETAQARRQEIAERIAAMRSRREKGG